MKTECDNTATLLVQRADGDLNPEQTARMDEHLASCAACREQRDRFRRIDGELAEYGEFVRLQPAGVAAPSRRSRYLLGWAFAFAVAAMAAAVIWVPSLRHPPAASPTAAVQSAPQVAPDRFVPIPYVPPLAPYEDARIVHMDVSVAALIAAGYRVQLMDPAAVVPADLLVGEDGRVHAIRLTTDGILN